MEAKEVTTHHIPKQDDTGPINVFIISSGEGRFDVTISHWGCSWSAHLFTRWEKEVEKFISTHESVASLVSSFSRNRTKKEEMLVRPVIEAVRKYFKSIEVENYKAPEGFVLVPQEATDLFKDHLKNHLFELWAGDHGCDWDGFVSVDAINHNTIWKMMIGAQEQNHEQ